MGIEKRQSRDMPDILLSVYPDVTPGAVTSCGAAMSYGMYLAA